VEEGPLTFSVILPNKQIRRDLAGRTKREAKTLLINRGFAAGNPAARKIVIDSVAISAAQSNSRAIRPERVVVAHLGSQIAKSFREIVLVPRLKVDMTGEVGLVEAFDGTRSSGVLGLLVGVAVGVADGLVEELLPPSEVQVPVSTTYPPKPPSSI
jgi:hypothetical protein